MPCFSVIVPIYNKEKYIEECVDSILAQDFSDFEAILSDDGSTDRSPAICDRYAAADPRIKVIHKENGGLSDARNAGLDLAIGEYILFLDGDDYWCDPKMLSKLHGKLSESGADVLIYGAKKQYANLTTTDTWISRYSPEDFSRSKPQIRYLMEENILQASAWSKAVRRELIENDRMRFVKDQLSEDIEWTLRLLMKADTYEVIPEAFNVYRQEESSISHNIGPRNCRDISNVLEKYAALAEKTPEKKEPVCHYLANQYLLWLTIIGYIDRSAIKPEIARMKKLFYLLDYDWYPYVKKAGKMKKLGFSALSFSLTCYRKLQEARKRI